jgi:hypothetical protein
MARLRLEIKSSQTRLYFILAMIGMCLGQPPSAAPIASSDSYFTPIYRAQRSGDVLKITYHIPYLESLATENVVATRPPFYKAKDIVVPLEFKLSNGTARIKFATSVVFKVVASRFIVEDFPYFDDNGYRMVTVGNLGWSVLKNLTASYALVEESRCAGDLSAKDALKTITPKAIPYGGVAEIFSWPIPYQEIPRAWNVTRSGDGSDKVGCVIGHLDYDSDGARLQRKFGVRVRLDGGDVEAAAAESAEYDLELEAGKSGYTRELSIKNYMLTNCVDLFKVRFSSNQSAFFRLEVTVLFSDKTSLPLGIVEVDYFRPKGPSYGPIIVNTVPAEAGKENIRCQ